MSNMHTRWLVGGSLLAAMVASGCDVNVRKCKDGDDAEICNFEWDEEDAGDAGNMDGAVKDAGTDGAATDGATTDATTGDGGVEGGVDASTGTLTIEQFCDAQLAVAYQWRDIFDECCVTKPASVTSFLSGTITYIEGAHSVCVEARTKSPNITYDGTRAGACAADFVKSFSSPPAECPATGFDIRLLEGMIAHGAPPLAQIPACRETFKGSVKQGQPCSDALECANGLRCAGETNKTCQNAVSSGGTCFSDSECVDGLTCVGSNATGGRQCRALAGSLAKCTRSKECETGLVCTNGECVTATASTPVCVP